MDLIIRFFCSKLYPACYEKEAVGDNILSRFVKFKIESMKGKFSEKLFP
jgi:hypothetical protein